MCNVIGEVSGRGKCDTTMTDNIVDCIRIDDVINHEDAVAVIYTQPGCIHCVDELNAIDQVRDHHGVSVLNVDVIKCNPGDDIKGTPTLDLYIKGKRVERLLGTRDAGQLEQLFREADEFAKEE